MHSIKNSQALRRLVTLWLKFSFAIVFITAGSIAFPNVANAACTCGFTDGLLTQNVITVDGAFADWTNVFNDTDNNVCDGPINGLTDADTPNGNRDLEHFAYTFDATDLWFFTQRTAGNNSINRFLYYADTNNDGFMATGEPVIGVEWKGSTSVNVFLGTYNATVGGAGDSMVDGMGMADGYGLPGTLTMNATATYTGGGSTTQMEFGILWTDLGVASGSAVQFHVSTANVPFNDANLPNKIEDNLGGCGGGPGSTQFAALTFVPDVALQGNQGATVAAAHSLTNDGNDDDTFTFSEVITGAHTPTVTYYIDDGDGVFEPGGDDGMPVTDSGVLTSGQTIDIWAAYAIAAQDPVDPSIPTGIATITVTATSAFDTNVTEDVVDTVEVLVVPSIIVVKTASVVSDPLGQIAPNANAVPGAIVDFTIMITNEGPGAADVDTVDIIDTIPANMELFTGDLGGTIPGPVDRVAGATDCVITFNWVSANDMGDGVEFSSDGGTLYTAMVNGGFDSSITHLAVRTTGILPAATGAGDPSCTFRIRMRIQ